VKEIRERFGNDLVNIKVEKVDESMGARPQGRDVSRRRPRS
jgi:hypothetical protein